MSAQPTNTAPSQPDDPYASPTKFCDLIMKGGITSGVVYPSAVCELAKVYTFKNIGGASAGAIAAAAAAAAECGRISGRRRAGGESGFGELERMPAWLAGNLSHLFRPDPPTRPLFNLLRAFLESGKGASKAAALVQAGVLNFPKGALAGMALGAPLLVTSALTLLWAPGGAPGLSLLGAAGVFYVLLLMILFAALGVAVQAGLRAASAIPENHYGICSGIEPSAPDDPSPPLRRTEVLPLTNWLTDELDQLAGLPTEPVTLEGGAVVRRPLTFGDLWNASGRANGGGRDLNLEMMTTNLTFGRPYRLPFETRQFFYRPEEFLAFFPRRVVEWMVNNPRRPRGKTEQERLARQKRWLAIRERQGLLPLPDPENLPVVVATRMSLSFPILLSAVPLYAVDWDRRENAAAKKSKTQPIFERCLFSDGGIGSNFPIHFFDQALPRWPTFGINLRDLSPQDADRRRLECLPQLTRGGGSRADCDFTRLVDSNSEGMTAQWDRFDAGSGAGRLAGFLNAIVNTMYNWADNAQMQVPGYRDRIVHVYTTQEEGGLNLNMSRATIEALSARGKLAGEKLRRRFTGADRSRLSWDNHRWVRYRSTMALIEKMLGELDTAYRSPLPGDRPYEELITRRQGEEPGSYPWRPLSRRDFAARATRRLIEVAAEWASSGESFKEGNFIDGAPRPTPEMRIKPRI